MTPPRDDVAIRLADTVTRLDAGHAGCVLVTGSHGGLIAARYAAAARVRAAIFNDAGRGLDDAGVAGIAWLARLGIAAAAVTHDSARIADAADSFARGRIGCANAAARACGVAVGEECADAARKLCCAPRVIVDAPPPASEGRHVLAPGRGRTATIAGLDSIGLLEQGDAGRVLVVGSHGGLHGGDPASALPVAARAAFFHDAGVGRDAAGTTRLAVLDARGMAAATVGHRSARIGDARSMWATGVLSVVNDTARRAGLAAGMPLRDAALLLARR